MNRRTLMTGAARASMLAALATGLVTAGGVASADAGQETDGDGGILSGNQAVVPIHIPVDIFGNAVGVLGDAEAGSARRTVGRAPGERHEGPHGRGPSAVTSGRHSIAGGNQIVAPIDVPITACGNAIAILGSARAGCGRSGGHGPYGRHHGRGVLSRTSGRHSIAGGNQIVAPVTAPIVVCGNAVGILGRAKAGCGFAASGSSGGHARARTSGAGSILGGNQVLAPIHLPVTICGNAIGDAKAGSCTAVQYPGDHPPGHYPPGHYPPGHYPPGHYPPGHYPPGHYPSTPPGHHPGHHPGHPGKSGKPAQAVLPAATSVSIVARPAAGEHGSGLLPHTGAPIGLMGTLAGVALAAGAALTTVGRRRSATVTAVPAPTVGEGGGAATNESVRR